MSTFKSNLVAAKDSGSKQADQGLNTFSKKAICLAELSGAITTSDVLALCRLPINARISSIKFNSDDLGTTGTFDVGFYQTDEHNAVGAAIDADALGTAIDVNAAAVANTEIRFETKNIDTAEKQVWELAGLSARPEYGEVFLCITPAANTTAGGTVAVFVEYQS